MARRTTGKKQSKKQPQRKSKAPTARKLGMQSFLLRESRKLSLLVLACTVPALVYVCTIPQQKKLKELETRLDQARMQEQLALEANDRIKREISAYRTNPDYLEIIARDRLNYYKEGETIIRIDR